MLALDKQGAASKHKQLARRPSRLDLAGDIITRGIDLTILSSGRDFDDVKLATPDTQLRFSEV